MNIIYFHILTIQWHGKIILSKNDNIRLTIPSTQLS